MLCQLPFPETYNRGAIHFFMHGLVDSMLNLRRRNSLRVPLGETEVKCELIYV